jgi:hypothetical protein
MKTLDRILMVFIGILVFLHVVSDSRYKKNQQDKANSCITIYGPARLPDGTPVLAPLEICKEDTKA